MVKTRDNLIESMARAAWEATDEPEPWNELPKSIRDEWIGYQNAAMDALAEQVPGLNKLLPGGIECEAAHRFRIEQERGG